MRSDLARFALILRHQEFPTGFFYQLAKACPNLRASVSFRPSKGMIPPFWGDEDDGGAHFEAGQLFASGKVAVQFCVGAGFHADHANARHVEGSDHDQEEWASTGLQAEYSALVTSEDPRAL